RRARPLSRWLAGRGSRACRCRPVDRAGYVIAFRRLAVMLAPMSSPSLDHLLSLLQDHTAELEGVSRRQLFGREAFFRDEAIFALVWKEGRIALRLTDPALFSELRGMPGTKPWNPSTVNMSGWLLVPEAFHADEESLDTWVRRAWTCAGNAPPKKAKAAK